MTYAQSVGDGASVAIEIYWKLKPGDRVMRRGVSVDVDEPMLALQAWDDEDRMFTALGVPTFPERRHYLLLRLVKLLRRRTREELPRRARCRYVAAIHVGEFPQLLPELQVEWGADRVLSVPSYETLAIMQERDGDIPAAITTCHQAIAIGLPDADAFCRRRARLERKSNRSAAGSGADA